MEFLQLWGSIFGVILGSILWVAFWVGTLALFTDYATNALLAILTSLWGLIGFSLTCAIIYYLAEVAYV